VGSERLLREMRGSGERLEALGEHAFDGVASWPVERSYELENWRRSIAMLPPGSPGLDREEAMRLLAELRDLEMRMRRLRDGLRGLLQADEGG